MTKLQIVFENVAVPGLPPDLRFVEVEDKHGHSISVGEWRDAETHPNYRILTIDSSPGVELDRLLNVIEAPTADASARIAAAERLTAIMRAQGLTFDTAAARKVLSARELRNRWYDAGKTDEAAELDEALGDTPASPMAANEQKVLGQKLAAASSRITQLEAAAILPAVMRIMDERKRQVGVEDFHADHDDKYVRGELAKAAASYAWEAAAAVEHGTNLDQDVPASWPWDHAWWKPDTAERMLEKAGAMIVAELERLERAKG